MTWSSIFDLGANIFNVLERCHSREISGNSEPRSLNFYKEYSKTIESEGRVNPDAYRQILDSFDSEFFKLDPDARESPSSKIENFPHIVK